MMFGFWGEGTSSTESPFPDTSRPAHVRRMTPRRWKAGSACPCLKRSPNTGRNRGPGMAVRADAGSAVRIILDEPCRSMPSPTVRRGFRVMETLPSPDRTDRPGPPRGFCALASPRRPVQLLASPGGELLSLFRATPCAYAGSRPAAFPPRPAPRLSRPPPGSAAQALHTSELVVAFSTTGLPGPGIVRFLRVRRWKGQGRRRLDAASLGVGAFFPPPPPPPPPPGDWRDNRGLRSESRACVARPLRWACAQP